MSSTINPILGYDWEPDEQSIVGWWLSEKFDGCRGLWDGETLRTRQGNVVNSPGWWIDALPDSQPLDGEIYLPGGDWRDVMTMLRNGPDDPRWHVALFMAFDVPCDSDGPKIEERIDALPQFDCGHVRAVTYTRIVSELHLAERLARVLETGGEGLVLRAPQSDYWPGRTPQFLKAKEPQLGMLRPRAAAGRR